MAVTYRVHEGSVLSYMNETNDLVWDVLRTCRDLARLYAPARTQRLRKSIAASRPRPYGAYQSSGTVSASVKHAIWVHEGTPHIFPKRGKYLTVPQQRGPLSGAALKAAGGGGKGKLYFLAKSVRGQRAQPFLRDALHDSLGRNALLYVRVS